MKKLILLFVTILLIFSARTNTANAQNGCSTTPPANMGNITMTTTTTTGTYKIWSRMKAADTNNNSFYIRIDSNCPILIGDAPQVSTAWTWVDYQNGNTNTKAEVNLTQGDHAIIVYGNEPGVGVDKILLTKNLICVPQGFGENCPAEVATPTTVPASQSNVGPRATPATPVGISVPDTIDKTGATDVTSALQTWINNQPSGTGDKPTILIFPSGATYKMNAGLRVDNKNHIVFWGYGATLRPIGNGSTTGNSGFRIQNSTYIKILGFRIIGANTDAGTPNAYHSGGNEYSMGIDLAKNTDFTEIADNWISNVFGDGVYLDYNPLGYPDNAHIHHNLIELTGRQGIVPDAGRDHVIEYNIIRDTAMSAIDAEDSRDATVPLNNLYIRNNLIDRWMWFGSPTYYYTCHALPMDYYAGNLSTMSNIYIENNTFQGGCMGPGNTFQQSNTDADISMWNDMPKSNIFIRNNTFNLPSGQRSGWAIRLNNITNGEVSGNIIPGQTVQCSNCTNVTVTNNSANSVTQAPTSTSTPTSTPTLTPTNTPTPTFTPTPTPTLTPTNTPTPIQTPISTLTPIPTTPAITSNGLIGYYFSNKNLDGNFLAYRIDSKIDFNWFYSSPIKGMPADQFSVRWMGFVKPPTTGQYTFYAKSDDGIRVWVNNQLIIDKWYDHSAIEFRGSAYLNANQKVAIRVEYYENQSASYVKLRWSGPKVSKNTISSKYLFTQ